MSPRTLFIIFLSSELHAGPHETKHNIFYFIKGPKNLRFEALYFLHKKGILAHFDLPKKNIYQL